MSQSAVHASTIGLVILLLLLFLGLFDHPVGVDGQLAVTTWHHGRKRAGENGFIRSGSNPKILRALRAQLLNSQPSQVIEDYMDENGQSRNDEGPNDLFYVVR